LQEFLCCVYVYLHVKNAYLQMQKYFVFIGFYCAAILSLGAQIKGNAPDSEMKQEVIGESAYLNTNNNDTQTGKMLKTSGGQKPFSIVALGDMPYFLPDDYTKFENVIRFLNTGDQDFNVFIGDIKSSRQDCSDEVYTKMFDYFGQFKKPLIYTPGDNEWTDCGRSATKPSDPEERLSFLRKLFFSDQKSLGLKKMELVSQTAIVGFENFVENRYWNYNGVSFGTLHLVGSNNNFDSESKDFNKEFFERAKANAFWLKEIFTKARENNSLGVVLFVHADMFRSVEGGSGFKGFLKDLKGFTKEYGKPVLLVNGDSHNFLVDKPLYIDDKKERTLVNFTRVQVFGEYDMHAVKIKIDPANPGLFEIQQLIIPQSN